MVRFSRHFQEVVKIIVGGLYYAKGALSIVKKSVDFTNILQATLRQLNSAFLKGNFICSFLAHGLKGRAQLLVILKQIAKMDLE